MYSLQIGLGLSYRSPYHRWFTLSLLDDQRKRESIWNGEGQTICISSSLIHRNLEHILTSLLPFLLLLLLSSFAHICSYNAQNLRERSRSKQQIWEETAKDKKGSAMIKINRWNQLGRIAMVEWRPREKVYCEQYLTGYPTLDPSYAYDHSAYLHPSYGLNVPSSSNLINTVPYPQVKNEVGLHLGSAKISETAKRKKTIQAFYPLKCIHLLFYFEEMQSIN